MEQDTRIRRREEARHRIRRQRQLTLGALVGLVLVAGLVATFLVGGDADDATEASSAEESEPAKLPRGGRSIFPERRVVAFYGAPQDRELGALGATRPARAARRLERQARPYGEPGRPVLPAFELITTIVQADPGEDGDHAVRQDDRVIERYLRAARREKMLLILDIQPGYASFLEEARAYERFLKEPDVSLALDPEWSLEPPALPGQEIGATDAATVNEVSAYLSRIVRDNDLPEKLLVLHRFTNDMIANEAKLKRRPGVALTVNVDGFGNRAAKISKYDEFTGKGRTRGRNNGFKLFYEEDTNLMQPAGVLRLRPAPDLVVYE